MNSQWYIRSGDREDGPLTLAEVRGRAADGSLLPTDRVSADRITWFPAGEVLDVTFAHSGGVTVVGVGPPRALIAGDAGSATLLGSVPGYDVQEQLGAGGCGIVYRAVQVRLGRVVALKTVRLSEGATADAVARFEREAVALAKLQHPNIVAVHDCGHSDGRAFFAMELLAGEDLKQRIDRTGPLDERTTWLIARQTAAALSHAAEHGIVHRDIKPANLFLVPPPTGFPLPPGVPMVKVTDFGLALTRQALDATEQHTAQGVLLGTPIYMAPEQFSGSGVDARADVYSLGATVHHALAGAPPFDGKTVWELLAKKSAPVARLPPPVGAATADLVAEMMSVDPKHRPQTYADVIARIDALLNGIGPPPNRAEPVPPAALARPSRRRRALVAGALVIALGTAVALLLARSGTRDPGPAEPQPAARPEVKGPVAYAVAAQELLYSPGSILGWAPVGGAWEIDRDDDIERTQVLTGRGVVVRALRPRANFRVALALDPHKADEVEVAVATAPNQRWGVRLSRAGGIAFGKRAAGGAFEPVGTAIPLPTPQELAEQGRRAYLEISYQRAGGTLAANFRDQSLGSTPDTGLQFTELRVQATGGPVRIDYAMVEELTERKP